MVIVHSKDWMQQMKKQDFAIERFYAMEPIDTEELKIDVLVRTVEGARWDGCNKIRKVIAAILK